MIDQYGKFISNFKIINKSNDLVVWRKQSPHSGNCSGHVVIFVNFVDENKDRFYAIESIRLDLADAEGMRLSNFPTQWENRSHYFLRK